ncbi:MAG: TlpA disulfide reductase family protein [bacterium]
MSRFVLILGVVVLSFGLYRSTRSTSPGGPKEQFRQRITRYEDDKARTEKQTEPSVNPIQSLSPELRSTAKKLGFRGGAPARNTREMTLNRLDGRKVRLSEKTGQWIVMNFWASWCGPCREEIPDLNNLHNRLNTDQFTVMLVNVMEDTSSVRSFKKQETISPPIYRDSVGQLAKAFRLNGLPVTWIISPDGKPVLKLRGRSDWDRGRMIDFFNELSSSYEG